MALIAPGLVVVSGLSGTGKSCVLRELAGLVSNSSYLEKDAINQGMMNVAAQEDARLPSFRDYVKGDSVFPDNAREVETIFGPMFQVDPKNGFYGRHGRDQAYMVMANIAAGNMAMGKIPMIDCLVVRQIVDGTAYRFLHQPAFARWPTSLVHFVTSDQEEHYQRHVRRAQEDPAAAIRDRDKIASRAAFEEFVTVKQPMKPKELEAYEHLLVDTSSSRGSVRDNARKILDYIQRK